MAAEGTFDSYRAAVSQLAEPHRSLGELKFEFVESWPKVAHPIIPAHLPEQVRKAFSQAERNFTLPDCEEAAATMYRRSLDVGLKLAYPDLTGTLYDKIKSLAKSHEIPSTLAEWAHEVRVIGNDGAHDLEGVTKEDVEAARGFIDTILRYLFTLPAQIAARRPDSGLSE